MRNFFNFKLIAAIVSVALAISITILFLQDTSEANMVSSGNDSESSLTTQKAIIIDQLYDDIAHGWFHVQASELLENAGYQVDIITTKDVTVDFYKSLPLQNYKIVVVRSHGVADSNEQNSVSLFTGEKYTTDKYISEQLFGTIKKGAPLQEVDFVTNGTDSQWIIVNDTYRTLTMPAKTITSSDEEYFLITPTFVETEMKGEFSNTIFVLGGCSTMKTNTMAEALVKRGASLVVGWDNTVGSSENDFAMRLLLEKLLAENMPLEDAVDSTMKQIPIEYMEYPARFVVYS